MDDGSTSDQPQLKREDNLVWYLGKEKSSRPHFPPVLLFVWFELFIYVSNWNLRDVDFASFFSSMNVCICNACITYFHVTYESNSDKDAWGKKIENICMLEILSSTNLDLEREMSSMEAREVS